MEKPSGCCDDDIGFSHLMQLFFYRDTTIDGQEREILVVVCLKSGLYLLCKFSCRCQDKTLDPFARLEGIEHVKTECECLT